MVQVESHPQSNKFHSCLACRNSTLRLIRWWKWPLYSCITSWYLIQNLNHYITEANILGLKFVSLSVFQHLKTLKAQKWSLNLPHNQSHVLNLSSHSAVRLRESLLSDGWSGHSRWLLSYSLDIHSGTSACLTFILLTGLTFLYTCSGSQLMIVLMKGAVKAMSFWFPGN